ncbi:MAG: hypothetical protein ASQ68_gp29 [Yellowstone Lake virophage 6]|uniref:hypothetical protein n=1 Tax=Yellowstone Lake virophage 6 TaxID=1557034 RepID=UPI000535E44E|nr:MAG: hypothetical protein ASQ68_gp29 [Yellowstone Lake virophage 6]AIW01919.1 MAG: hypothetical protein YSLV6_ORF29 [Yellowstone Lake virophage 6]
MNDYNFEERDINSYVQKLKDVFNIISLTRKYKVIGSSNLKNIRYNSDFDLSDFYNNSKPTVKKIVKYFQFIYKTLDSKASYSYITDFKCGLNTDGEALKWTKQEILKNKKELIDGSFITLDEAIQEKSTIKIDVVSYINNTFIEISENYYIKMGNISNFDINDFDEQKIISNIHQSEKEEVKDNNYNKALKRHFSWNVILNKNKVIGRKMKRMVEFFNSSVGILNKARADLDVLILLLETNKPVKLEQLLTAIDNIKFNTSYNTIEDMTPDFLKLGSIKNKKKLYKPLVNLREQIYNIVNNESKKFYIRNKL